MSRVVLASGLSEMAGTIAASIKEIIMQMVDFLTPIVTAICLGMILVGAMLIALRQEFYGIRLIVSGAVGLAIVYLGIPLLLSLL